MLHHNVLHMLQFYSIRACNIEATVLTSAVITNRIYPKAISSDNRDQVGPRSSKGMIPQSICKLFGCDNIAAIVKAKEKCFVWVNAIGELYRYRLANDSIYFCRLKVQGRRKTLTKNDGSVSCCSTMFTWNWKQQTSAWKEKHKFMDWIVMMKVTWTLQLQ